MKSLLHTYTCISAIRNFHGVRMVFLRLSIIESSRSSNVKLFAIKDSVFILL
ncbi:hypothetical protein ACS0TY_033181 [Phlomoides rotata]